MEYEFDIEMEDLDDENPLGLDMDDNCEGDPPELAQNQGQGAAGIGIVGAGAGASGGGGSQLQGQGLLEPVGGHGHGVIPYSGFNIVVSPGPGAGGGGENPIPVPVREADMDSGYSATPPTPVAPNNSHSSGGNGNGNGGSKPGGFEAQEEEQFDADELCLDIDDPDLITIDTSTATKEGEVHRGGRKYSESSIGELSDPNQIVYITPISIKGLESSTETDANTRIRYYINPFVQASKTPALLDLEKQLEMDPETTRVVNRAKRFGLASVPSPSSSDTKTSPKIETSEVIYKKPADDLLCDLYQSLNLYDNPAQTPTLTNVSKQFRLDGVLIRGTRQMSSNDIFQYLRNHEQLPIKMEWINDSQCKGIVIFSDQYEAGRALLEMSKPIGEPSSEEKDKDTSGGGELKLDYEYCDVVPSNAVEVAMPISHTWRYAVPCDQARGILMTIPRKSDKKQEYAERVSEFYRKHGNPNKEHQGLFTSKGYNKRFSSLKEEAPRPKIGKFDKSRLGSKAEGSSSSGSSKHPIITHESEKRLSFFGRLLERENKKRTHMDAFVEKPVRTIVLADDDEEGEVVVVPPPPKLPRKTYGSGMVADREEELMKKRGPRIMKVPRQHNPHDYDPFLDGDGEEVDDPRYNTPTPERYPRHQSSSSSTHRRVSIKDRLGHL